MLIRPYQANDAEALATIYRDAVIGTGASMYDAEQIAVWSSYPEDIKEFRQLLGLGLTLVSLEESQPVAFGQLNPLNHIAYLYTTSKFGRRGYATEIYKQLETYAFEQGIDCLFTEASRISKFFFLKMGFQIIETEVVERKGVQFERFKMQKKIYSGQQSANSLRHTLRDQILAFFTTFFLTIL